MVVLGDGIDIARYSQWIYGGSIFSPLSIEWENL